MKDAGRAFNDPSKFPDLLILRWLARRTYAAAPAIGAACAMVPGEIRARLASLESRRLVSSRSDKDATPPRRVFFVTGEGRRAAGIIDTRQATS